MNYSDWLREALPPRWTIPAHIEKLAEALDAITAGEIDRLAIHCPPRHGKTENVTIRFPIYCLAMHPENQYLLTAYNERMAQRFGRKARALAKTRLQLSSEKKSADEWTTLQGGGLMTRGVGSPPTGVGFQGIVIDDPVRRREDAESEVYREKLWDWYTDDLYTRLEPDGFLLMVMTLWHEDDVGARAVASEPNRWHVLRLPALAEEDDSLGRVLGEALWPERFPVHALERIRDVMGQNEGLRSWEALYQCRPSPREGQFFQVSKLSVVNALPVGMRCVRAWDLAASLNGKRTAGVKMAAGADGLFYVADVVMGQWESAERNRVICETARLDGVACRIRLPQDPGQAGKDQAEGFVRMLAGFNVKVERVTGDKTTRADPFAAQVNAGNVRLLEASWNLAYREELRTFLGRFTDQVDASADAFAELTLGVRGTGGSGYAPPVNDMATDYRPLGF